MMPLEIAAIDLQIVAAAAVGDAAAALQIGHHSSEPGDVERSAGRMSLCVSNSCKHPERTVIRPQRSRADQDAVAAAERRDR